MTTLTPATTPAPWNPQRPGPCSTGPDARPGHYEGTGTSPLTAFADALAGAGHTVTVLDVAEQPAGDGVAVCAECRADGGPAVWGAGRDASSLAAAVRAVLPAVNRAGL